MMVCLMVRKGYYLLFILLWCVLVYACSGSQDRGEILQDTSIGDAVVYDKYSFDGEGLEEYGTEQNDIIVDMGDWDDEGLIDEGFSDLGIDDIADITADTQISYSLTPELIGFEDGIYPSAGSLIFYNNWSMGEEKDSIEMISPNGDYKAVRVYANRIWSFGVSSDGRVIAFSSADPYQEERYGIGVYDAIQYTWLLKENEPPLQITFGPINDECHNFIRNDSALMICRRANFRPDDQYMVVSDPYRILIHDLDDHSETYLTPLDFRYNDYYGSLRYDGNILFNRNTIADRTIDIMILNTNSGEIDLLQKDSSGPVVSVDGKSLLFKRRGSNRLFLADVDNISAAVPILDGGNRYIANYVFSPDKNRIAYTLDDPTNNCFDLMVADIGGENIRKILDCSDEKKFITVIKWVNVRPEF